MNFGKYFDAYISQIMENLKFTLKIEEFILIPRLTQHQIFDRKNSLHFFQMVNPNFTQTMCALIAEMGSRKFLNCTKTRKTIFSDTKIKFSIASILHKVFSYSFSNHTHTEKYGQK